MKGFLDVWYTLATSTIGSTFMWYCAQLRDVVFSSQNKKNASAIPCDLVMHTVTQGRTASRDTVEK